MEMLLPPMPVQRDDVHTYVVADDLVLYDAQHELAVSLNVTAAAIWELCDGTRSRDDILSELASAVGGDEAVLSPDVDRVLQDLKALGLLRSPQPKSPQES